MTYSWFDIQRPLTLIPGYTHVGGAGFAQAKVGGLWTPFDANVAPIGDDGFNAYEARTNSVPNPVCSGAAVGSPGTMPTNWTNPSGVTSWAVIGTGVAGGLPYIDVHIQAANGTGATTYPLITFFDGANVAAANGQIWTSKVTAAIIDVAVSGLSAQPRLTVAEYNDGTYLTSSAGPAIATAEFQECSVTRTLNQASTNKVRNYVSLGLAPGQSCDFVIRLAAPQLKQGVDINDPPILQASGAAATRTAVVMSNDIAVSGDFAVVAEFVVPSVPSGSYPRVFSLNDGTISNKIEAYFDSNQRLKAVFSIGGTPGYPTSSGVLTAGDVVKAAFARVGNAILYSVDGATVAGYTGASAPAFSKLNSGCDYNGGQQLNSQIRQVTIKPGTFTQAQLNALTAA